MREILFRGKRKDNGEWVYGDLFNNYNYKKFIGELIINDYKGAACDRYEIGTSIEECITSTVGQYTGLTDKNGKKIFEGDILKHHVQGDILVERGVVEWEEQHGRWVYRLNSMKPTFYLHNPDAFEVIGNIHDNPELLKGGDENDT